MSDNNDARQRGIAIFVLATVASIGWGFLYYANNPNIFEAIGGVMVGWAVLVFFFGMLLG